MSLCKFDAFEDEPLKARKLTPTHMKMSLPELSASADQPLARSSFGFFPRWLTQEAFPNMLFWYPSGVPF